MTDLNGLFINEQIENEMHRTLDYYSLPKETLYLVDDVQIGDEPGEIIIGARLALVVAEGPAVADLLHRVFVRVAEAVKEDVVAVDGLVGRALVLLEIDRMNLAGHVEEFGRSLGEELLEPTRIYAKDCLALAAETQVRTFSHITGGGLAGNLERVIPHGLVAEIDRGTWTPAPVFGMIAQRGRVERVEMEKTFNMGVGMIAVLPADEVDRALAVLTARHVPAWVLGEVRRGKHHKVVLKGDHPRF